MITVQSGGSPLYVVSGTNEYAFDTAGVYQFPTVYSVGIGTNPVVEVGELRSGAVIVVDAFGGVVATDGPDLVGAGVSGFALVLGSLGMLVFIRWVYRFFVKSVGVREIIE